MSKAKGTNQNKIRFKYIFKDDYNPNYCTGAQGAFTPAGDFVINFYSERGAVPRTEHCNIREDGTLETVKYEPTDVETTIVRYITSGVVLNSKSLKQIYELFGRLIEQSEV